MGGVKQILAAHGMTESLGLILVIIGKFSIIIPVTIVCSKWNFVRRLFGFKYKSGGKA